MIFWRSVINLFLLAIIALGVNRLGINRASAWHSILVDYNGFKWDTTTDARDVAEFLLSEWGDYEQLGITPLPETQIADNMTITISNKSSEALSPIVATNLKTRQNQLAQAAQAAKAVLTKPKSPIYSGLATWYRFGDKLTAASRKYPKGTRLKVVAVSSGKSVEVTINDYGPSALTGIDLDLNVPAFEALAPLGAGKIKVKYYKL